MGKSRLEPPLRTRSQPSESPELFWRRGGGGPTERPETRAVGGHSRTGQRPVREVNAGNAFVSSRRLDGLTFRVRRFDHLVQRIDHPCCNLGQIRFQDNFQLS